MRPIVIFLIIMMIILLMQECVIPAPLSPRRTGEGTATTSCAACTMYVSTKFRKDTLDFPNRKEDLSYLYDSVTLVTVTVKPVTDQVLNVRLFDKDVVQVYLSADVAVKAGDEKKFSYQFKPKK